MLSLSRNIAAAPSTVFQLFTDLEHAAERIEGIVRIEMLTAGPMRVGTRWRETRIMFGREDTQQLEVTAFEPERRYCVGCESCGARFETEFRFLPEGSGTRVEMDLVCRPLTLLAKLMTPLSRLMTGPMKKMMEQDLDDLKRAAEEGETKG